MAVLGSAAEKANLVCKPMSHLWRMLVQVGTLMAGTDKFYIRVQGVSGHGGTPHLVKDTVVAAAAIVMNLQPLISRETDPAQGGIVGVTLMNSGMTLCYASLASYPDNAMID